jgi:hypothetical protein
MRYSAALTLLFALPTIADATGERDVDLSDEQRAALREVVTSVLPDEVDVAEMRAYTTIDVDRLMVHSFSTPYNIEDSTFNLDAVTCSRTKDEEWRCYNYDTLTHVYIGSVEKTLWLKDGIKQEDALKILRDALNVCELEFDVPYRERPQLAYKADPGYFIFRAPKCHYQYHILDGQLLRGKAFHPDTKQVDD